MSISTAPATLPLRVPWATVIGSAAVASFFSLWVWALPASADSTLTIHFVQLALAASAAYIVDDAAAALTSVAPRSLWQHRAFPLLVGLAAIEVSWVVVLIDLRQLPQTALRSLTIEVTVLVLMTLAASAVLAARGEPEPGNQVAIVAPLTGVAALVLGGILSFDLFIGSDPERGTAWIITGVLALATIAWATRDKPC